MSASIGVVANPASGKDVRRLAARASVFDNREKAAIVTRAITGAVNAGARSFAYLDDSHNIAASAMQILPAHSHPLMAHHRQAVGRGKR